MGINCSTDKDQEDLGNNAEKDAQTIKRLPTKLVKKPHLKRPAALITDTDDSKPSSKTVHRKTARGENGGHTQFDDHNMAASVNTDGQVVQSDGLQNDHANNVDLSWPRQYDVVEAMDHVIRSRGMEQEARIDGPFYPEPGEQVPITDYEAQRDLIMRRENALSFDYTCTQTASKLEKDADLVLQQAKEYDLVEIYDSAEHREGYAGQKHRRVFGDHFLSNVKLIERTRLYHIAHKMPKGAHLHIHFNANLDPKFLIDIAATMPRMYISSDIPLLPLIREPEAGSRDKEDGSNGEDGKSSYYEHLDRCKIQFQIIAEDSDKLRLGSLFDAKYSTRRDAEGHRIREFMQFQEFRKQFKRKFPRYEMVRRQELDGVEEGAETVDRWLCNKLVFHEQEAHDMLQTANGAWEKFNARTQMMKGLFNYEKAYREYTRGCLEEFRRDNIQYAEIRPNFMPSNQLWTDDGKRQAGNGRIIQIIIEVYKQYEADLQEERGEIPPKLKIIYCTPRSFKLEEVEKSLEECLEFKLDQELGPWIAGFDLVGEESKGKPLREFAPILLSFQAKCRRKGVDIPFLFHCGETLEIGTDTDQNLVDALLLGSKRIGHGFALARHPYIMEQMKQRNVCLEVCPISNEILGLTPRMSGHSMYNLLANNVHCTVSTDNGAFFRSTLSHDFYQVFAGKADMTLHGWRQLIEWSIEHACLDASERSAILAQWKKRWDFFCKWIVETYGTPSPQTVQNGDLHPGPTGSRRKN